MKHTSDKPLQATKRAPYQPVTRLEQVPIAFYEILDLATRGEAAAIVPLIQSVITVTQIDPDGLANLPHVASGTTIAKSSQTCDFDPAHASN